MNQPLFMGLVVAIASTSPVAIMASTDTDSIPAITLEGIEITANRAGTKTPVAFSNISASEIARSNDGHDLPYLLQSTPSVVVTGDAGAGIGYSAIRVRGTDATRVNITANGVPINDSESHVVYWVNTPDLVSSMRDIQIQRGAGTSTNGAGAFGASINMITAPQTYTRSAELSTSYGSFNSNKETIKLSTGLLGGHWSADLRLSHIGSDGYIERSGSELWGYQAQLGYKNDRTWLRLLAFGGKEVTHMAWDYASKEQMKKYGRRFNPCGEYTDTDGKQAFYKNQCDNFTQHHIQLLYNQELSSKWQLNATLHYTRGDGYYEQYKANKKLVTYGLAPYFDEDGNKISKQDIIRLKFNDNHFGGLMANANYHSGDISLTVGGAANWFNGGHYGQVAWVRNYIGAINPLQRYYDNTGRKADYNIFARADYSFAQSWNLFADMQYRHIDYSIKGVTDNYDYNTGSLAAIDLKRKYDFLNPKIGISYNNGPHRAYASWSVAHKEPVRDNFTDGDPHIYPHAERLFDYEAGYTFTNSLLTAGANLYYMDYKDQLVVTGQLSDTGNPLSINVPRSYRMGIELMWQLRPVNWFNWDLTATLSQNRVRNFKEYIYDWDNENPIIRNLGDTPLAFSPDFTMSNSFNFIVKGFDASLTTRYISSQYMNNARTAEAKLDAYTVTDLNVGYTFTKIKSVKELRIGVGVYNLFNEKYFNNGYASADYYTDENGKTVIERWTGFAAQATTNFMATVTFKF